MLVGTWTVSTLFQSLLSLPVHFHSCIIIFLTHKHHGVQLLVSVVLSIYYIPVIHSHSRVGGCIVSHSYTRDACGGPGVRTYVWVWGMGIGGWAVGPGTGSGWVEDCSKFL